MIKVKPKETLDYKYKNMTITFTPKQTWYAFINPKKISLEITIVHDDLSLTIPVTDYYNMFRRIKDGKDLN